MQLLETDLSPENLAIGTKNVPVLKQLSKHESEIVRRYVAGNPHTPYKVLVALVQDTDPYILWNILAREKIPIGVLLLIGSFDSPCFVKACNLLDYYHLQVKKHQIGYRHYKKKILEKYKNRTDKRANTVAFIY